MKEYAVQRRHSIVVKRPSARFTLSYVPGATTTPRAIVKGVWSDSHVRLEAGSWKKAPFANSKCVRVNESRLAQAVESVNRRT